VNVNETGLIQVGLISPVPAIRSGLKELLTDESGLAICAEAASVSEIRELPGVLDLILLATWGARLLAEAKELKARAAVLPVVFLTETDADLSSIQKWMQGAWGVLPLTASADELSAAIHAVYQGLWVSSPELFSGWMKLRYSNTGIEDPLLEALTERETEILQWMATGLTNKQIAARLHISSHTVKYHISSIYSKMNVSNRTEAAREGLRTGKITL
jgi:two-component system, NarL family, response regulator YdfI